MTIDRDSDYYPVPIPAKVPLNCWEGKDAYWVNNSRHYSFEINNAIYKTRNDIIDLHKSLHNQGRKLTFYHIDKLFNFKGNRMHFNDYFKNYMRKPPPTVTLTGVTWEKYDGFIKLLDRFNPAIRFDQLDLEMVARIRNHLAEQRGRKGKLLAPATIKSYFDRFKVVLEHAAKKDGLL